MVSPSFGGIAIIKINSFVPAKKAACFEVSLAFTPAVSLIKPTELARPICAFVLRTLQMSAISVADVNCVYAK